MSRLTKVPADKGQKSLFSFFTKKTDESSIIKDKADQTQKSLNPTIEEFDGQKGIDSSDEEWSSSCDSKCGPDDDSLDDDYVDEGCEPPKKRVRLQKASVKATSPTDIILQSGCNIPPMPKEKQGFPVETSFKMHRKDSPGSRLLSSIKSSPLVGTPRSDAKLALSPQLSASKANEDVTLSEGVVGFGTHEHHSWEFLINRTDKNGFSLGHPSFDNRTIKIPQSFMKQQTPAMRQWFEIKSEFFDTVLFFKVGKFYELFHMDADVGVKEADLIYMKGFKAHCGFPEVSYGKYASALVAKGYRVARVEQTETPEMMKERNKANKKGASSKVVARELCSIMSKGTRTYCHLDDLSQLENSSPSGTSSSLLMCILERSMHPLRDGSATVEYGICFVDTVLNIVTLAQFEDGNLRYRLRTLLSRHQPTEVLLENNTIDSKRETLGAIQLLSPSAAIDYDACQSGKLNPSIVVTTMKSDYFKKLGCFPPVMEAAEAGLEKGSSDLMLSALGVIMNYLKRGLIDFEIFSFGKFMGYIPPDSDLNSEVQPKSNNEPPLERAFAEGTEVPRMVLDSITLSNLEILKNNFDNTENGSLWAYINRCQTAFGKRLLRDWVCRPLLRIEDILYRSEAVAELLDHNEELVEKSQALLKKCPDLDRLLSRVHSNGLKKKEINHPDSRSVMYESASYNARKISNFTDILRGFDSVVRVFDLFSERKYSSKLLRFLFGRPAGMFPLDVIKRLLSHFREIFDENQAKRDGFIRPLPGVNTEYDEAKNLVTDIEKSFDSYLLEQKRETGIRELSYFGSNKDRYQLEVPMSQIQKVPKQWSSKSQKKTHRRFWTPFVEENLARLVEAEERLSYCQMDAMRRVFEMFDQERSVWSVAVDCTAIIDALFALVSVSNSPGYCWASFEQNGDVCQQPSLVIEGGRHPMLEKILEDRGGGSFIANDLTLGIAESTCEPTQYHPSILLVSGPNMGGKSTLLRQTCLITIMAQIGCKVPATRCSMSPVDRVFTRIGASDKIMMGQSTFFVELAETALILKHATKNSLCILDELGRGTSTFDGSAIAHAVVENIVSRVQCRTLFATHYHTLIDEWSVDPRIKLGHMDCYVQSGNIEEGESLDLSEEVTFLYRLRDGSSPKSYGINVAKLARLPPSVLMNAYTQSKQFEEISTTLEAQTPVCRNKFLYSQFFDRAMSIVHSNMSNFHVHFVIQELWKRFVHLISRG